jgi:hypothetical protein
MKNLGKMFAISVPHIQRLRKKLESVGMKKLRLDQKLVEGNL